MIKGHRILVTGASSGLGRDIALQLACDHKAEIIATGRRKPQLLALAAEAKKKGGSIIPLVLDQTDEASINTLIQTLAPQTLDGIILNAGVTYLGGFETVTADDYQRLVQTNVTSNIDIIYGLTEALERSKGRIMLVTSMGGLTPLPYQSVYAGSKAFMTNFGLSLAAEYAHKDIAVSVAAPGGIATEMTAGDKFKPFKGALAPSKDVARTVIKSYIKRRPLTVPGAMNKLTLFVSRFLPRTFMAKSAEKIYRRSR